MSRALKNYLSQRGTAVITALMMVAIASAIAVAMMTEQRINIRRTQQLMNAQQAFYLSDGALYWAKALLNDADPEQLTFPVELPETEVLDGQGRVRATLISSNELINLNNLADQDSVNKFIEAIQDVDGMNDEIAQNIINAINAWTSNKPTPEFDEQYLALPTPYRAAHQAMQSKTELRQVLGVTQQIYQQLQDKVVAYPAQVSESYFLHTAIELRGQILNVYTVLHRGGGQGKVDVEVTWQSRGTW